MIGNRMKNYSDVVLEIYKSNSEIGNHTYSHKDLSEIDGDELDNELNSTNIIYSEITNDTLKYLRPPYNNYGNNILDKGYEIVTWSIDTNDWLNRNSDEIYNNVINNICDGCIVLMHDVYEESIEATKKLIPKLHEMGYEIVSISDLARIKGYDFTGEEVTSIMKSDE
jgi:peptidoglycan/xylan/chitin deacetylase (PgdA/CDA1 family)